MGTRGLIGFFKNGVSKLTYNHMDSYPKELGVNILEEIRNIPIIQFNDLFNNIIMVDDDIPTQEQINDCSEFYTHKQDAQTWYNVLRLTKGTLKYLLNRKQKYMVEYSDFIKHSLFCEWAYIINLDTNKFEIWRGFITEKNNDDNRYRIETPNDGYYACEKIYEFPIEDLPSKEEFLKIIGVVDRL